MNKNKNKTKLFESKQIGTVWDKKSDKRWFSVVDVCAALIDSDYQTAENYWGCLKKKLANNDSKSIEVVSRLKMQSSDGKFSETDAMDTGQILHLIESIPSKKTKPLKIWLAKIGGDKAEKNYEKWMPLKARLHNHANRPLGYKEREVWWCSIGENIGFEQDGKNRLYNRPVLIFKIFNREMFWGIPLTSKTKIGKYYYGFRLNGINEAAILSQLRVFDTSRLDNGRASAKIGTISYEDFREIQGKIVELIQN